MLQGVSRQTIEIKSQTTLDVEFKWHLGAFHSNLSPASGQLQITPCEGRISPGRSLICRLDYEAGLEPECFDCDAVLCATPIEAVHNWKSEGSSDDPSDALIAQHPCL